MNAIIIYKKRLLAVLPLEKILVSLILLSIALPSAAKDKPGLIYRGLEFSLALGVAGDTYTTFRCLDTGKAHEENPIANLYMANKPLAIAINGAVTYGTLTLTRAIRKKSKLLAITTLIVLNGIEFYMVMHNSRVFGRVTR